MPFLPIFHQFGVVRLDPLKRFIQQVIRAITNALEGFQTDPHIHRAADQVDVRRQVIALTHFQPIPVAKAPLGRHADIVWKYFLNTNIRPIGSSYSLAVAQQRLLCLFRSKRPCHQPLSSKCRD
jgi:hypothetical protein